MPALQEPILESVIKITEKRNTKALSKLLAACLSDLVEFKGLILLQIPRLSTCDNLEVVACIPNNAAHELLEQSPLKNGARWVKRAADTSRCIETGEVVLLEKDGINRVLFPVRINGYVALVLDIHGCRHDAAMEKTISTLLAVCSNFLGVMEDNEHDTLTGLLNRKTFDAQLSELLSVADEERDALDFAAKERRVKRDNLYHWVGILDIDHFKNINDIHGHVLGDEVLLLFADLLKNTFRNSDLLFRYGGEEFVVVLSPLRKADAFRVFDRFRTILEAFNFPQVGQVTASIGMVSIGKGEHQSVILEKADKALYYAKENGRNRVCEYQKLIDQGFLVARHDKSDIELF